MAEVHVIDDGKSTHHSVEVWLDTEVAERDGLIIGVGETPREAIDDAIRELDSVRAVLVLLRSGERALL